MIKLNAKRIKATYFSEYSWFADLIEFEGPLLSLYRGSGYNDALYFWLDNSDRANRWCIVPVERTDLDDYIAERITLKSLIFKNDEVVICNHFAATDRKQYNLLKIEDFPEEYCPDDDSYLYEEIASPDALKLRSEQTQSFMLGIDNQLFIDDLSIIPRTFQQLYSFHYGLSHLGMTSVRDVMGKLLGNWTGGASAVNIFTGLKNIIPVIHRPQIASLQFNSPGHIELNLLPNLALSVERVADRLSSEIRTKRVDALYKSTYSYFTEKGLSGFDDERGLEVRNISPETLENIVKRVRIFFKCFGWTDYHSKFNSIDAHPLQQLRAVLAYYRRLRILNQYIVDDKLEIGRSRVVNREA